MKLHLPLSLRSSLLALFATVVAQTAQASLMSNDASLITYTDFGQNCGRYVAGDGGNALLKYIRQQEGGIAITYTNGQADYIIPNSQGMVDFSTGYSNSTGAAISPSLVATVGHNGELEGTFTTRVHGIGSAAINYAVIGFGTGNMFSNSYNDGQYHDYRISRYSKIFTDVTPAQICSSTQEANELARSSKFYHSGGGFQKRDDGTDWPYQGYVYPTGGIISAGNVYDTSAGGVNVQVWYHNGSINNDRPLNYASLAGDSGSPVYVYDAEDGVYKFWGCAAMSGVSQSTYLSYTNKYQEVMNKYNKVVNMPALGENETVSTVYLNAVNIEGEEKSDGSNSTRLYYGAVTDANGNELTRHVGLQTGLNTWKDLDGIKNNRDWYAYGNNYVNQSDVDLFFTENLVFNSSAENNAVVLNATVDLGIGYTEFNAAGSGKVSYTISSAEGGSYMLNSAGYVVNENASVHVELTSAADHMYEWRKTGAGDFYIEGKNDNNVLLNLGGTGTTYLKRESGYAAYNVLVNTGATVVIDDICQIERDLTFGHKGGVLDMNGNDMDWYVSNTADTIANDGFTIKALTEDAVIANRSGSSTLTYKEAGDTTYAGSFADSADSSLKIVYDVAEGSWTLNSIRTNLQHEDSGLQVDAGRVILSGTNTVHGTGSATGRDTARYFHEDDWHYADAKMEVRVTDGGTFELGSHARLTGDVTVESGGLYVMREGVKLSQEYVEGGQRLEDTAKYAAFYGHKGNTSLAEGASMQIAFSDATTATNTYNGNISGAGSISVNAAKGILQLGGTSTLTGKKTLTQGGLVATTAGALGETTTNKWVVGQDGWIASHAEDGNALLARVDETSTGTLALSSDTSTQLTMSTHKGLYLGAEEGKTVQYGELGTSATLNAVEGAWRLGGGGGTLVVNYVLSGDNSLLLGSSENARGTVHLTNTQNSFTGSIVFNSTGVILTYEDGALGKASVSLDYSNSMELLKAQDILQLSGGSDGMVLVDAVADAALTLSNHANLALGASTDTTLTGTITVAENQAYRFGAQNGATLRVESALAAGHDVVVDAQGSSGGKVVLAGAETLSGKLTVQGNKTSDATGDITLELAGDMALEGAAAVQNGGAIDVAGHTLTSKGELNGNGTLTDSSSEKSGSLVLDMGAADKTIDLNLQLGNIEKHGSGTLNLTGNNNFGTLTVKAGTVSIDDSASSAGNLVVLEAGTTMSSNGNVLADISMGDGSVIANNGNRLKGQISVQNGATAYYNSLAGNTAVDNSILLGEDSTLYLGRENGVSNELDLKGNLYGQAASGRMVLRNINKVNIDNSNNVHFAGTFEVDANTLLSNKSLAESKLREFDRLRVNAGKTLSLTEVSWNTIWNIHELTGDGDIRWTSTATHSTPSVMRLDGEGSFSGDITVLRTNDFAARRFQAFVELQHDKAAQNATLVLAGDHANAGVALAVNTDNAHIAGLQNYAGTDASTTNAYVIAGPPPANTSGNDPVSGRSATLTFTGSGEYTFSGKIGHADDTVEQSLSLVMNGTGSQTLDGSSVIVNNVSALKGSLNIAPASLTVLGDVSIAEGAALELGESYTLCSGQTLSVLDSAANSSALFNSNLVLGGGDIYFDFLSSDYAALDINGAVSLASGTNGLNINFADNDALQIGVTYQLAGGDWSQLAGKISMFTPEMYKNVTLTANSDGLSLLLSMKEGFSYWQGTNSEFGEGKSLVFLGGEGALGHVEITGGAVAAAAVFDNTSDFTISATDGSTLAFDAMEKSKSGALIVNTKVMANSLNVVDAFALGGTGTLSVGDMTGTGTLQVQNGAHLQVESAEGAALHLLDGATLTTTGTQIASDVTLGQEKTSSLVTLDIQGATLSLSGEVSSLGSTTLAVQGTGTLNYHAGLNDLAELRLSQNTDLNVATTLSTKVQQNGATVNVNNGGTWQLEDDHGAFDGAVVVNAGGRLEGGDMVTEKSFSLGGSMSYDSFTVQNGGTLNLQSGGRLDATNAATISGSGTMNLNGNTLADKVHLKNGGTMYGGGGTIDASAEVLVTEGSGTLSAGEGTLTINGQIGAAEGATLLLAGTQVDVNTKTLNASGGSLELQCAKLRIGNDVQSIEGTLSIGADMTLSTELCTRSANPRVHSIETLEVLDNHKLTILQTVSSEAHVWNVGEIAGNGEILWSVSPYHHQYGVSRMVLSGENSFAGTLKMRQNYGWAASYPEWSRLAQLVLAHDGAARNMVISVEDSSNVNRPGIAINTQNAHVQGLNSIGSSDLYAGSAITSANMLPTSTELNTLTVTGGGTYSFAGDVHGTESYGLNIVMAGSGSQSFTGTSNVVHDVTALQGHLNFTNAPTIYGDVSIAQGAQLTIGSGAYSLESGHSLSVLAGAAGSSATLNNALVLNGGSLIFGAYGETSAALITGGVSLGAEVQQQSISFTNLGSLSFNKEYTLASGDWSALAGKLTIGDSGYLIASLSADANGLRASFEMAADYVGWTGDETVLTDDARVVFAGFGGVNTAEISENHTVAEGYFDNGETFTVSSANGSGLQFVRMEMTGSGAVVLNTAVSADTMIIKDAATIKGTGSLTVENLDIQSNLTTGMALDVTNNITAANGAQWILDGSEGAFTQNLSINQMTALGSIRVEGDAVLSVDMGAADMSLTDARISGSGRLSLTGSGSFTKNYNGALNIADISLANATFKGNGTTTISGEVAISGKLDFGTEKVILASGAEVTTNQLRLGTSGKYQNTSLSIEAGATLNISGTTFTDAGGQDETISLLLAHWQNSASTLVLNGGTLEAGGTAMHMGWDSGGAFQAMSGVANLKGILFSTTKDHADRFILGSEMSGTARVNIGSAGITGFRANDTVQLGNGTIAATSDFSITGNGGVVQLVGEETGTIFDTAGHTITVNSVMQGEGKLVVNGSGALKLAHSSGTSDISDLSGTGKFVKDGAGNLNLHKASLANATFKGNGTVNISGAVDISGELSIGKGTVNLLNGASVTASRFIAGNTENYQGSIVTIKEGADLTITGNTDADTTSASFILTHWKESASTMVLDGGKLTATDTCMLMGWDSAGRFEALSGEATLKGIRFSSERHLADTFILRGATVNIGSGGITGFSGNDGDSVQLGDGTILAMDDFVISGSKSVVLNGTTDKGTVFDANGHTITVQAAMDSDVNSALTIQNGTLKQSGDMWFDRMHVAEGASFVKDSVEVIGQSAASAIVKSANASGDKLLYFNDGNHEIQNARVKVEAADARELKSQLTHSTVENAGSGHLTVSNTANTLSGVVASGGDMAVLNQGALSLDILDVAGGKTVGLYTGADTASEKAAATVSGTAAFGTGAVLNTACLTLADGATLEMTGLEAGAVNLSGALTFGTGLKMGESLLASVGALDYGETLNLFTGLSGVNLPVAVDTESSRVLASSVFSNVQSNTLYVGYRVIDNVGSLLVVNVPEPATATLSLMALAALAARRRRKV